MQVVFHHKRYTQYFFYLYHLSQWHFSCIPKVVESIITRTGQLTQIEQQKVSDVRRLFQKYSFGKKYLGTFFIEATSQAECFSLLQSHLDRRDYQALNQAMSVLKIRFDRLWSQDRLKLRTYSSALRKAIASQHVAEMKASMRRLFGEQPEQLNVVLVVLPGLDKQICGSANTPGNVVTMELGEHSNVEAAIRVLLHELSHKQVRRAAFSFQPSRASLNAIRKKIPQFSSMTGQEILEEIFLQFLLPDGFLAKPDSEQKTNCDPVLKQLSQNIHILMKNVAGSQSLIREHVIRHFIQLVETEAGRSPL